MQKQIASIYFDALYATRPLYGGYYPLPAVPKGGDPAILVITDKIQQGQEPSPDGKSRVLRRDLILGEEIANDIIDRWTRDIPRSGSDCGPGVWIVRDSIPELDAEGNSVLDAAKRPVSRPATEEEKRKMWDEDLADARLRDANWADVLIEMADVYYADPKSRRMITPVMKKAAIHYGADREWVMDLKDQTQKRCPFCTKIIPGQAVKCPSCNEIVDEKKYAEMDQARRRTIAEAALNAKNKSAA